MTGMEVAFLAAAIVTAYPCITELFRDWRKKHEQRRKNRENAELQRLLEGSPKEIQCMYDDMHRDLGRSFARGDERSCNILKEQLETINKTIKSLLKSTTGDSAVHPHHDRIYRLAYDAQQKTLTAMQDQYQRLRHNPPARALRSTPRQLALPEPSQRTSRDSTAKSRSFNCSAVPSKKTDSHGSTYRHCEGCGWVTNHPQSRRGLCFGGLYPRTTDNCCLDWGCLWQKFHHASTMGSPERARYRCIMCKDGCKMSVGTLIEHIYENHRWSEICDGACTNTSGKCGREWHRDA